MLKKPWRRCTVPLPLQLGQVLGPEPLVYLGDFLAQVVFVAFRQAAGHQHAAYLAGLFGFGHAQDGIDGFLFGIFDKATCIDHHRACLFEGFFVGDLHLIGAQLPHQDLRVVNVLGASEGDHVYFFLTRLGSHD